MPKLLLVDGYSLLYRAYFSSPPLTTKAGEPTGALYGFIRMVIRLLDEHQPDFAVVALDPHGPTFRHEQDSTYKATRSETPDDLRRQQVLVRELLDGLCIPRYEHAGYEADDVLGTLAARGASRGEEVLIVTGDGDSLQLVSDSVRVLLTRKGVTEIDSYGPAEVEARFGFEPRMVPDFKGLKGDTSDNIPGVPGIGDKTGMSLIQKFGSMDGIYERLEEVTPPRIRELLRTHKDQALHSRHMATIVCDLPIEAQPEDFRYEPTNAEKCARAAETARRFEFKSLATRFESGASAAPEQSAPSLLDVRWSQTGDVRELGGQLQNWGPSPLALLETPAGLWFSNGQEAVLYTGDWADSAVVENGSRSAGASASGPGGSQGALDFGEAAESGEPETFSVTAWLQGDAPKVVHEVKPFLKRLAQRGVSLGHLHADTQIWGYLADPTRQGQSVEALAQKYLNLTLPQGPEAARKGKTASLFEEDESPEDIALRLGVQANTVAAIALLEGKLRPLLEEMGHLAIWQELECPLALVLSQMESCGMQLDPAQLQDLGKHLEAEEARLQAEIWELAGEKFNIGSPKQLQVILFDKLGLEKGRSTKTGASTDVHTLEKLSEQHEIVRKILDYRGITKLKSTYVDALLTALDQKSHRIHTTLNQTGAVSGRLSSTDPNLQNIPIRTEQGRLIRKAFVAPEGQVLLSADYSQIELRILAHITGDAPLVDAFRAGEDVHSRTAAALFHVPVDQVDKEMRRKAKMTNYAIAYGVSGFGLAKQLGSGTAGEAQEFIKDYFATLPGVKKYIDDTLEVARAQGYISTLMGRRRPLPDIKAPRFPDRAAAERTAINHPIQGTAADVMKLAMLAVQAELERLQLRTRMTMQVHDELVFEVPHDEVETVKELVARLMAEVPAQRLNLSVPLVADVGVGSNWDDAKGSE